MFKDGNITKSISSNGSIPVNVIHQEKILLKKRQHWFTIALSIFTATFLGLLFIILDILFFSKFLPNIYLLLSLALIILLITTTVAAKLIVDWYCHFYLLTAHRILEVCYKPLFTSHINNVILNQVKSTEIDIEKTGFINQLLDNRSLYIDANFCRYFGDL